MKWSRRSNNSNNIYYGKTSEGEDGFLSPPAAARAQNSGKSTPGMRSSSASTPRTRSSGQTTTETSLPAASKKIKTTVKDIREALGLPESAGRGIPSSKDRKKVIFEFSHVANTRLINFTLKCLNRLCDIICPKDPHNLLLLSLGAINVQAEGKLAQSLKQVIAVLTPRSFQCRALIAPLAVSYKEAELLDNFGIGRRAVIQGRKNFTLLAEGKCIKEEVGHHFNYDKATVYCAVHFILNDSNVQRVSWGTKTILLDGNKIDFPRLIWRKLIEYMLHHYIEYFPMKYSRIGNTSFKKGVKALTTQDQKARKAVDYVSGRIMYDNFDLIRKILSRSDEADDLKILDNSLEAFLKSLFEEHIFKCCVTNPEFAFATENSTEKQKCTTCTLSQYYL